MSKFDDYLAEASLPHKERLYKKEYDEGDKDFHDVMKTKNGETNSVVYKQFPTKGQADAYAKVCNKKSTTHKFHVRKS